MEDRLVVIPENVIQSNRVFGFKKRNLVEGLVWAGALVGIIWLIPFVLKAKIVFSIILGLAIFIVNAIGIHGDSLTAAAKAYITYKKCLGIFHFRRLSAKKVFNPGVDKKGRVTVEVKDRTVSNLQKVFHLGGE